MGTKIITECDPTELEREVRADLRAAIAHSDLTMGSIAQRMGCSRAYISAVLKGDKPLSLRTVVAIALAAGWVARFDLIDKHEEADGP